MFFTLGDLVIVGLVAAALAVFRQLDRNNRSLEKVKRLGEKVLLDIDSVAQERSAQLKDIAIEVEVHQQASKKVVERLEGVEASLSERTQFLDELQKRIDNYDNALQELITMTQKAEENIGRLRDESAYIDKVGRRIRQAAGQLQDLQNRIPGLMDEFKVQNSVALSETGDAILQNVQQRLEGFEYRLSQADHENGERLRTMQLQVSAVEEELASKANAYRGAFDRIEKEYIERAHSAEELWYQKLDDVAARGLKLETDSLAVLVGKIEGDIRDAQGELNSLIDSAQIEAKQRVEDLLHRVDEDAIEISERMDRIEAQGRQSEESFASSLGIIEDKSSNALQRIEEDFRSNLGAQAAQIRADLSSSKEDILGEIAQVHADFGKALSTGRESLSAAIVDLRMQLDNEREATKDQLERAISAQSEEISATLEANSLEAMKNLSLQQQDLAARIEKARAELLARTGGLEDDIQKVHDGITSTLAASHHELESKLAAAHGEIAAKLEGSHNGLEALLAANYEEFYKSSDERHNALQAKLDAQHSDISGRLDDSHRELDARLEQEHGIAARMFAEEREFAVAQRGELDAAILKNFEELSARLEGDKGRITQGIQALGSTLGQEISRTAAELRADLDKTRSEMNSWIGEADEHRDSSEREIREAVQEGQRRLEHELAAFEHAIEEKREGIERLLEDADGENKGRVEAFQAAMRQQVEHLEDALYAAEKGLEQKLAEAQERGRTLSETVLHRISNDVDTKTESMREAINQRVDQVNASVKASHDQIDESFNELRGRVDSWIGASQDIMSKLEDQVRDLNESSRQANQEHKSTVEMHIRETRERLDSYEAGLSTRVGELEAIITRAEDMVKERFDSLHTYSQGLAEELRTTLDNEHDADKAALLQNAAERFEQLGSILEENRRTVLSRVDELRGELIRHGEDVHRQMLAFEHDHEERRKHLDASFADQIGELQQEILQRSSRMRSDVETLLTGHKSEINQFVQEQAGVLMQADQSHKRLSLMQEDLNTRLAAHQGEEKQKYETLRQESDARNKELEQFFVSSLARSRNAIQAEFETTSKDLQDRVRSALAEAEKQAHAVGLDINNWKSSLDQQIEELRGLAQGLYGETLGNIQASITAVQKQAQELYERIQTEVAGGLQSHEEHILSLLRSNEQDVRRLQALGTETQAKIGSWQDLVGKTGAELQKEVQALRDEARQSTTQGLIDIQTALQKRQSELSQQADETAAYFKNEMAHQKSDFEQDLVFVKGQMSQLRESVAEDFKTVQENARALEAQTLTSFRERADLLREEARMLTKKAQDEFAAVFGAHQTAVQGTLDAQQNDLRKSQQLVKDLAAQSQALEEEIARSQARAREQLSEVQGEAQKLAAGLRESVKSEIEERHRALMIQVKQVLDQIGVEIGGSKTQVTKELELIEQQIEATKGELLERVKSIQADGAILRRDTMASFQERLDAVRDEARKLTGSVKAEIATLLSEHQGNVEKQVKQTEDEYHRIQDLHATSQIRFQEIQDIFSKAEGAAQKEFEILRDKSRALADQARAQFQSDLSKQGEELAVLMRGQLDAFAQDVATSRKDMSQETAGLRSEFDHWQNEVRDRFDIVARQMNAVQEQTVKSFQSELEKIRTQNDTIAQNVRDQAVKALEQQRQALSGMIEQANLDLVQARSLQGETGTLLAENKAKLEADVKTLESMIDAYGKDMAERIRVSAETHEQAVLGDVERRLKDYEKEIGYRIEKIETVNDDIDNLESNLRISMERLTSRLREDFNGLGAELRDKRVQDQEAAQKDMEAIRLQMISVEKGLDELKERAYDNVNQKLKVFEDEFFVDLRDRSLRMETRMGEWTSSVSGRLEAMASEAEAQRVKLEERYEVSLRERLADLNTRLGSQFEQLEGRYGDFQSSVQSRLNSTESRIGEAQNAFNEQIQTLQSATIDDIQREFVRFNQDVENRLRGSERELEARITKSDKEIRAKVGEFDGLFDTVRSDVGIWQNQVLQQMRGSEAALQQDLGSFRSRSNQTLTEIRDDFVRQKDELLAATNDERAALRQEIQLMADRVARAQADIEYKSKEALDLFARQYQSFHADMERSSKDVQDELDEKSRSFRQQAVETREEFENMQRKIFAKLDEDTRNLDLSLREIDKRIKSFMTQTKLFERADSLKDQLGAEIEKLRVDLINIEKQRETVLDLDQYLAKVRKLAEEANEKLTRLGNEKRRIDALDEDYKKLVTLSTLVDQKLSQVTTANDVLSNIQLSIRQIEESQKRLDSQFERLEKKSELAESASEGIDKNFQNLHEIEKDVQNVRSVLSELPRQVNEISERVATLTSHKKEADAALKSVTNLDKVLKDVEGRITELNKARDWIARTETRLSELTSDADEKANLLSTLARGEAKSESGGAAPGPSNSVREVVLKLSQQGWRIEEIAKTTKLSRGEVELIIEMSSR